MAIDRPDWTQGIDIEAQTLAQLNIDIIAQTLANLKVDIAAQTVAQLDVDIMAQTVAELTINIIHQAVGIYLQPEWAAKTGEDKNFDAFGTNRPWLGTASGSYTVPAGKTLYITDCSFVIRHSNRYDTGRPLYLWGHLFNDTTATYLTRISGIGGASKVFSKPLIVSENETLDYKIYNSSLVLTTVAVHVNGFEV